MKKDKVNKITRSGNHNARADDQDYNILFSQLTETEAHMQINGRRFGDISYPENLFDDERFNEAEFYRWIVSKNKEAQKIIDAKRRM